ncbi:MAG: enhanced serine sensitivity protein SseB C-terminal domain-containing protein [Deltaproteobacteria bacterium]|nr:enhanced serine sensitivity protein SseB C-terminal domain-containing protein [Deltaproteobacteria bacterium]
MKWLDRLLGRRRRRILTLDGIFARLARGDAPEDRGELYRTLLESTLLIATPGRIATGKSSSTDMSFIAAYDPQGDKAMVAFTCEAALFAWRPSGCDFVELEARAAFQMALQKGLTIVINPGGPSGGYLTRSELTALSQGAILQALPGEVQEVNMSRGTSLSIGKPAAQLRPELLARLRESLAEHVEVIQAWVVALSVDNSPPRLVVAVQLTDHADPSAVFAKVLSHVGPLLPDGEYLDIVPVAPGSELFGDVFEHGEAIFRRALSARA